MIECVREQGAEETDWTQERMQIEKLHSEKHHNLYSSPDITRMIESSGMRWVGHIARTGEMRNAYKSVRGKSEGKKSSGLKTLLGGQC